MLLYSGSGEGPSINFISGIVTKANSHMLSIVNRFFKCQTRQSGLGNGIPLNPIVQTVLLLDFRSERLQGP